jgi:hypothetical protein
MNFNQTSSCQHKQKTPSAKPERSFDVLDLNKLKQNQDFAVEGAKPPPF